MSEYPSVLYMYTEVPFFSVTADGVTNKAALLTEDGGLLSRKETPSAAQVMELTFSC